MAGEAGFGSNGVEGGARALVGNIVLVRHGQTTWSASGRHTGRTDLALTDYGRDQARLLRDRLSEFEIVSVYSSPLQRSVQTAELSGFSENMWILDDLCEWDYGLYEGITTAEIQDSRPGWDLFRDGCPEGEDLVQVTVRATRALKELAISPSSNQCALIFAHGHLLRVLASCYLHASGEAARRFVLAPASISVLSHERSERVIQRWNS